MEFFQWKISQNYTTFNFNKTKNTKNKQSLISPQNEDHKNPEKCHFINAHIKVKIGTLATTNPSIFFFFARNLCFYQFNYRFFLLSLYCEKLEFCIFSVPYGTESLLVFLFVSGFGLNFLEIHRICTVFPLTKIKYFSVGPGL
jgi:hypothetical protein